MTLCRLLLLSILVSSATPIFAGSVQVDQTGPETFTVTFEKTTRPGGIEGAMKGAKRYAAALCTAAKYEWYRVLDRHARQSKFSLLPTAGHTAGVEVRFLDSPGEDGEALKCTGTKKDLRKMKKWLRALDYGRPEPSPSSSSATSEGSMNE